MTRHPHGDGIAEATAIADIRAMIAPGDGAMCPLAVTRAVETAGLLRVVLNLPDVRGKTIA